MNVTEAFEYIEEHGLCDDSDYPYSGKADECRKVCKAVAHIKGFQAVKSTTAALETAVAQQPVVVGMWQP